MHDGFLTASITDLHARMREAHPIDAGALDDTEYHGISLGLPAPIESLTWKTFKKVFRRDSTSRVLRGWNVAVEQDGVDGTWRDRTRGGRRITYGHYEVRSGAGLLVPRDYERGLVLDYGRMAQWWSPMAPVRDALLAVNPGSADLLIGWLYLDVGLLRVPTPSFFLLQRGGPLSYDLTPPRRR